MENKPKILIVDDEENICELVRLYIEKEGFDAIIANDGQEAVAKFNKEKPDLILLDIMLPIKDGWQVCREIRAQSKVPIIMLTAKGETFDKVLGLELGADDYVVKPFEPKELIARIRAVLRRSADSVDEKADEDELSFDGLKINQSTYEVYIDDKKVEMPPKEFDFYIFSLKIPIRYSQGTSSSTRYGAMSSLGIPEQLMFI